MTGFLGSNLQYIKKKISSGSDVTVSLGKFAAGVQKRLVRVVIEPRRYNFSNRGRAQFGHAFSANEIRRHRINKCPNSKFRLECTRSKIFARLNNASRTSRSPRHSGGIFPPRLQMKQPGMRGGSQVVAATKAPSLLVPVPPCVQPARGKVRPAGPLT